MPNGIDLLVADHELVNQLFQEFEADPNGVAVGRIADALKAHDEAEQAALYPMLARGAGDRLVARALSEHSAVKRQLDLVLGLEGPPLADAVRALRALVTAHVEYEEGTLFPELTRSASPAELEALGARLLQAKQRGG